MTIFNIINNIEKVQALNPNRKFSDIAEWALADYYNIERHMHDSKSFDKGSDVEAKNGLNISVKTSHFTLFTGTAECQDMDSIWEIYERRTHSNQFAYVSQIGTVYMMTLSEFKRFVYANATVERDSKKNGGNLKIRGRKESQKMLDYLALMA